MASPSLLAPLEYQQSRSKRYTCQPTCNYVARFVTSVLILNISSRRH
uniref:Uncharacterized protein n=1 Tax=Arundo donax TaxID=35708 RepID=A0A0A9B584_ARUDO